MLTYTMQAFCKIENESPKYMDAEAYYRLVLIIRSVAVSRPQNLFNFEFSQSEGNYKR